jgi:hypothetical protein
VLLAAVVQLLLQDAQLVCNMGRTRCNPLPPAAALALPCCCGCSTPPVFLLLLLLLLHHPLLSTPLLTFDHPKVYVAVVLQKGEHAPRQPLLAARD